MVAVEERWDIIRFALETFPVISIYHLAKASISERPRLYLLFSYSDIGRWLIASSQPPSLSLSLCVSLQNIVVTFAYLPACLNNALVAC